jgi:hypothetical protein
MWRTFPKNDAYELRDYVSKKQYMRAYMKMRTCYQILHDLDPDRFTEFDLDLAINGVNNAIDNHMYKDAEFKEIYDAFVQCCDDVNLILPSKLF